MEHGHPASDALPGPALHVLTRELHELRLKQLRQQQKK
jgi:hypothetical protein